MIWTICSPSMPYSCKNPLLAYILCFDVGGVGVLGEHVLQKWRRRGRGQVPARSATGIWPRPPWTGQHPQLCVWQEGCCHSAWSDVSSWSRHSICLPKEVSFRPFVPYSWKLSPTRRKFSPPDLISKNLIYENFPLYMVNDHIVGTVTFTISVKINNYISAFAVCRPPTCICIMVCL